MPRFLYNSALSCKAVINTSFKNSVQNYYFFCIYANKKEKNRSEERFFYQFTISNYQLPIVNCQLPVLLVVAGFLQRPDVGLEGRNTVLFLSVERCLVGAVR